MCAFSNPTGFGGRDMAVILGSANTVRGRGRDLAPSEPFGVSHRMNRSAHRRRAGAIA